MMRQRIVTAVIAGALLGAAPSPAEEPSPGRAAYLKYCGACHGSEGQGNGVVAGLMTPRPTDLTRLAAQHGGKFPYVSVTEVIDGRKNLAAHGSSEMPVWGEIFRTEKAAMQGETLVRGQVQLITDYVASIQAR